MKKDRILIVDDDRVSLEVLLEILSAQGWEAVTAETPVEALQVFSSEDFDLVISDINLESDLNGLDLLRKFRETCPVILITGFGTLTVAARAAREGAWDLISKPFKVRDVLDVVSTALNQTDAIERTKERSAVEKEEGKLVGRAPLMLELYKDIVRVAPSMSTVLITGESGTGKELVAQSIHHQSSRAAGPFVAVNCGALTESLLEAELFGYVKGAFTGAYADRRGLWEEAEGGTLFLDEIGEISPAMQVKLLRALQEKEIRRVGATRNTRVDARVVAATNRDLKKEIERGVFREDLYYRLKIFTLKVPGLRERRGDIPLLAERFLEGAMKNAAREGLRFSEEAMRMLASYDWPGNVRELTSAVEYAALHARGDLIVPEDLPQELQSEEVRIASQRPQCETLYEDLPTLDELERRYLVYVLKTVGGSRPKAASLMGINRRTLYRMCERLGVSRTVDDLIDSEEEAPVSKVG